MSPAQPSLLIVDDDVQLATQVSWALKADYSIRMAHTRPAAIESLAAEPPDLVLLDLCLPPGNVPDEGFRILAEARKPGADTLVIVNSGLEEREPALRAIAEGAYDFFTKPVDLPTLRIVLARAAERQTSWRAMS